MAAGGAQYWKEEEHGLTGETVNANRFARLRSPARPCHVGRPFCNTMMSDANREQGDPMQVRDVAELVVEAMRVPLAAN